ncbi:MAG: DNA-3-methyladenine glycosylase 2 family protein [Bacteroidota bacterium]|nr:DNA-3-methyladenine glycosylase 2 family protein [Bacteroidota bacterium]MDX5430773.1 DNA-3-methyladenine glycosylase 2 family protein [Bacteroidota bacterium]MDX5469518.1 DNA-3-methyladenine glycosylase 2 family protein [Bacteroidota bacterium]
MPSSLFKHDPEFYEAVKGLELEPIVPFPDYFNYMLRAIAYQQLSGTAGATIHGRFLKRFPDENPSPQLVLDMPFEFFREAGLSGQKSTYMQNIARFWIENKVNNAMLEGMLNVDLIAFLTQIKGVGRWTAEMLMIFGMGRKDVFPLEDLVIQQAFAEIFGFEGASQKELKRQMIIRSERWEPHRSTAARLLWAWKDQRIIPE